MIFEVQAKGEGRREQQEGHSNGSSQTLNFRSPFNFRPSPAERSGV